MSLYDRHLEDGEIENYCMGAVSEEDSARYDEHLLICESCRNRVTASDEYVSAMQGAALQSRRQSRRAEIRRTFFPRLIPIFSAAALLGLIALAAVRPWVRSAGPAVAINLEATRGAGIEARAPAERELLLNLQLAGLPTQSSYRVEAVDRLGKVVWQGVVASQDAKAVASVPRKPAGTYFVRVYGASGELLREYGLELQD